MRTGEKNIRRCAFVSKVLKLYLSILHVCVFSLFLNSALTHSGGLYPPFIPPLALFLPLHLLFLPPLPQSCVSLPFASTSLPLFSLTLKSSQSLCFPSFTASTCWQEEKEEDAALTPQCCRATPLVSADCL